MATKKPTTKASSSKKTPTRTTTKKAVKTARTKKQPTKKATAKPKTPKITSKKIKAVTQRSTGKKSKSVAPAKTKAKTTVQNPKTTTKPLGTVASKTKSSKQPATKKISSTDLRRQSSAAIYFSLEDVREFLRLRQSRKETAEAEQRAESKREKPQSKALQKNLAPKHRIRKAASTLDIIGFNPRDAQQSSPINKSEAAVPKKFLKYYRSLLKLRTHVLQELDLHTRDTLQHASKEDNGAPLKIKEGDSDNLDQEFALSLVSSEQEALLEIEEALKRIFNNTYGVCEITGKPINRERLAAVPFTRFSIEGQAEFEARRRQNKEQQSHQGFFTNSDARQSAAFSGDNDD